jgi:hypothetical protein
MFITIYFLVIFSLYYYFKNSGEKQAQYDLGTNMWLELRKVIPMMLGGAAWEDGD